MRCLMLKTENSAFVITCRIYQHQRSMKKARENSSLKTDAQLNILDSGKSFSEEFIDYSVMTEIWKSFYQHSFAVLQVESKQIFVKKETISHPERDPCLHFSQHNCLCWQLYRRKSLCTMCHHLFHMISTCETKPLVSQMTQNLDEQLLYP